MVAELGFAVRRDARYILLGGPAVEEDQEEGEEDGGGDGDGLSSLSLRPSSSLYCRYFRSV